MKLIIKKNVHLFGLSCVVLSCYCCVLKDLITYNPLAIKIINSYLISFSKWSWSLHFFFGRPMFLRPFGLYRNACFGSLFVSILCMCCSQFLWYCFISFTHLTLHEHDHDVDDLTSCPQEYSQGFFMI